MRAGVWAAIVAAAVLGPGAAWAACSPAGGGKCVVNLGLAPQVSQDIVAAEPVATPAKRPYASEPAAAYSGPTIGINQHVRQAPEIGYRWAIN